MPPEQHDVRALLDLMELTRSRQEAERFFIARHLHDEIGQRLAALKMNCFIIGTRLSAEPAAADGKGVAAELKAAMALLDEVVAAVRELSEDVWPGLLHFGIGAAVEWQAGRFQSQSDIACVAEIYIDREPDRARATMLYRIFQDALGNVKLHENATMVEVTLRQRDGEILLALHDDGRTPPPGESKEHDLGILNMRERTIRSGGVFSIDGSAIEVRMPFCA